MSPYCSNPDKNDIQNIFNQERNIYLKQMLHLKLVDDDKLTNEIFELKIFHLKYIMIFF
jgi:hypothetical protein